MISRGAVKMETWYDGSSRVRLARTRLSLVVIRKRDKTTEHIGVMSQPIHLTGRVRRGLDHEEVCYLVRVRCQARAYAET